MPLIRTLLFLLLFSYQTLSVSGVILTPDEYSFGNVKAGTIVEGSFIITGEDSDIHVLPSCSCISVMPNTIPEGKEELIVWSLDTSEYEGPITLDIKILTGGEWVSYLIAGTVDKTENYFRIWPVACVTAAVFAGGIFIRMRKNR